MKATITINQEFEDGNGRVFASLLRRLARIAETKSFQFGYETPIKDAEGNICGKFEVEK